MALKMFGEFEIEHLLPQQLFQNDQMRNFLSGMGFTKEMRGNKVALYANPDHVALIQGASPDLVSALIEAGWGIVRHEGGDNDEGGKQAGKNAFFINLLADIKAAADLPVNDDDHLTPADAKLAVSKRRVGETHVFLMAYTPIRVGCTHPTPNYSPNLPSCAAPVHSEDTRPNRISRCSDEYGQSTARCTNPCFTGLPQLGRVGETHGFLQQ